MPDTSTYIDRTKWASGPWDSEPDRELWTDEATGLTCLIRRNYRHGNLCGYVAVPPGHAAHGRGYDDLDVDVHGGLTYAAPCDGDKTEGICHTPEPGQPDDLWWFGFDCHHAYDKAPLVDPLWLDQDQVYRSWSYVRSEVSSLATQLVVAS